MAKQTQPFSVRGEVSFAPPQGRTTVGRRYKRRRAGVEGLPSRIINQGLSPTLAAARRTGEMSEDLASLEAMRQAARSDPAIAICTIRYAYTHHRGRTNRLLDLDQICNVLGSQAMLKAFGSLAGRAPLKRNEKRAQDICNHCVRVGVLGAHLAKQFDEVAPATVHLAGLLHDIGKLLIIQAGELDYEQVPLEFDQPNRLNIYERRILGYDHAKLGWHAINVWGLPEPLSTVIAWHHQGSRAYMIGGAIAHTVALLRCADLLDRMLMQHESMDDDAMWKVDRNLACRRLELAPEEVRRQWDELRGIHRNAVLDDNWFEQLRAS